MDTIILIGAGGFVIWILSFVAKLLGIVHENQDFHETLESKSRDPQAYRTQLKQQRSLNRWRAAAIATVILLLIILYLYGTTAPK